MGVYLSTPVKEKFSSNHENSYLRCGASSMQGWRMSQEDAHNCCLDFDSEVSLFAVYDGHGGAEVAEYASKHLPDTIKATAAYKEGNFEKALIDAFLELDASLITEPVLEELRKIAGTKDKTAANTETEEEDDEDDVQGLREEARMPLADVIARYANGIIPKTPALKRIKGESSKSPYLQAKKAPSASGSATAASSTSDAEVSSSCGGAGDASGSDAKKNIPNGIAEASSSNGETSSSSNSNGETAESAVGSSSASSEPSTSPKKGEGCDLVTSSSAVNGETPPGASGERSSAKKAKSSIHRSLLAAVAAGDDEDDESDSDENDESFSAANIANEHSSDEEDVADENGADEEEEEDEDEEDEEDEEEDEEDEEDDAAEVDLDESEEPGKDSGCTAVVSLVTRNRVIVANAGDSRAVLSRAGQAVDLSIDHKPEDLTELNRIVAAGGRISPDGRVNGGLNLSRALGDHMYKKTAHLPPTEQMITALPDIKVVDLKEGEDEFIVLACDGIWNSMSSQEVVDFVRPLLAKGNSLSEICEKLFDSCLAEHTLGDGTGCDNMTCVIVELFPKAKGEPGAGAPEKEASGKEATAPGEAEAAAPEAGATSGEATAAAGEAAAPETSGKRKSDDLSGESQQGDGSKRLKVDDCPSDPSSTEPSQTQTQT